MYILFTYHVTFIKVASKNYDVCINGLLMPLSTEWSYLVFNVSWFIVHLRLRLISFLYAIFNPCISAVHLIKLVFHEGKLSWKAQNHKISLKFKWTKVEHIIFGKLFSAFLYQKKVHSESLLLEEET